MGRRTVPGAVDVRVEAWAPTREECVAEAVAAVVESFADRGDLTDMSARSRATEVVFEADPGSDEDLLVDVLEEVIYLVEVAGQVPLATAVVAAGNGLQVRFEVIDAGLADPLGQVPKVVSFHGLRIGPGESGWSCAITLNR